MGDGGREFVGVGGRGGWSWGGGVDRGGVWRGRKGHRQQAFGLGVVPVIPGPPGAVDSGGAAPETAAPRAAAPQAAGPPTAGPQAAVPPRPRPPWSPLTPMPPAVPAVPATQSGPVLPLVSYAPAHLQAGPSR